MENLKSKLNDGAVIRVETPGKSFCFASALNPSGIAKLLQYAGKGFDQPLVVCVDNRLDVLNLTSGYPEQAYHLSACFWPGNLHIVLRGNEKSSDLLSAGNSFLVFNMPASTEFRNIIASAETPLAVCDCSGSESGGVEIISINEDPFTADYSVVSFVNEQKPLLVSEGCISSKEIVKITGTLSKSSLQFNEFWEALSYENSLSTPFFVAEKDSLLIDINGNKGNIGIITFGSSEKYASDTLFVKSLSDGGDMCEAAVNFFSVLREMDQKGFDSLIAETLPDEDIGKQINLRLKQMGMDLSRFAFLMNESN